MYIENVLKLTLIKIPIKSFLFHFISYCKKQGKLILLMNNLDNLAIKTIATILSKNCFRYRKMTKFGIITIITIKLSRLGGFRARG
jgi:hypothetical protein